MPATAPAVAHGAASVPIGRNGLRREGPARAESESIVAPATARPLVDRREPQVCDLAEDQRDGEVPSTTACVPQVHRRRSFHRVRRVPTSRSSPASSAPFDIEADLRVLRARPPGGSSSQSQAKAEHRGDGEAKAVVLMARGMCAQTPAATVIPPMRRRIGFSTAPTARRSCRGLS